MTDRRHAHRPRPEPDFTLRVIVLAFLPAAAIVVGVWIAVVYVLTGGPQ